MARLTSRRPYKLEELKRYVQENEYMHRSDILKIGYNDASRALQRVSGALGHNIERVNYYMWKKVDHYADPMLIRDGKHPKRKTLFYRGQVLEDMMRMDEREFSKKYTVKDIKYFRRKKRGMQRPK